MKTYPAIEKEPDYINKQRKEFQGGIVIPDSDGFFMSNKHNTKRVAKYKGSACYWWLRSPGYFGYDAANVGDGGLVDVGGDSVNRNSGGVRPALWLNLKSEIFKSISP